MSAELSFLLHPVELLLRHVQTLVTGINRVDAVYYDPHHAALRARQVKFDGDRADEKELMINDQLTTIEKLRKGKTACRWFSAEELPYQVERREAQIGNMFSELKKVVLMAGVPNMNDEKNDLLFFYFSNDLRQFGPANTKSGITAAQKDIISKILMNAISTILSITKSDRESWKLFADMAADNRRKLQQMHRQLEEMSERYEERLLDSCKYVLAGLSRKYNKRYVFTDDAIKLVRGYKGEYHKIENALKQAVNLANMLREDHHNDAIEIGVELINFTAGEQPDELEEQIANSVYEKPYRYLEMLEEAAMRTRKNKRPVTGKNVAEAMEKPVKPPAITWAINKHMKHMQQLFRMYPDKWPVIRSDFKPILRISA